MPYNRPGTKYYAENDTGGTIVHGSPVVFDNIPGIATKQKAVPWAEGLASQDLIQDGESFVMDITGVCEVDNVSGFAKGDAVYIIAASESGGVTTFELTETAGSNTPFGRVVEVVGDGRGVPAGKVRINLDTKDLI